MNKGDFVSYIAKKNNCSKVDAERTVDMVTGGIIGALAQGDSVALVGFGNFSVSNVKARPGRNPRTGEIIQIKAYKQPKFKVGQKLKDACNR